ncbi:hypothetical protein IVB12_05490 [Bradyrhizobium sp. 179]|uniref:hypothetical protein n=1 Tax=Bradyrhizobium sp. 179 TaxID=2782648 RepID=UPI001FF7769A|nr:hypothetical protein [Bradyrhizobium sp. 179]MCK1541445.1 hypothetical protein [Bradyrhizobium sp. 179]
MAGPVKSMLTVTVSVKLPFWWKAYVGALRFFHDLGLLRVNPEIAADFIVRNASFQVGGKRWRGKRSR